MMFVNENQRLRVCKALARAAHLEHVIGEERPTEAFYRMVEDGTCSAGEWLLLQTAHAVWTGSKVSGPSVGVMLAVFDEKNLTLVGELLQALAAPGERRLEAWLARAGFPRSAVAAEEAAP
jgi:hypothetical protein